MPAKKKKWTLDIDTSQDNLVIVESPAKAKTIKKYLGKGFEVVASMGHIRDLPKKDAIDIDNNFATNYEVAADKKSIVSALKKAGKSMKEVRLATDEDREWEAIARHLCEAMWLDPKNTKRIVFHEITQDAIQSAIQKPRTVDIDLVNAQQARRVLDRLVGFDLSPVLRKKIKTWLSAGRVQSVAVRLLAEREREIMKHSSSSSYKTIGTFQTQTWASFDAELQEQFEDQASVEDFLHTCEWAEFSISDIVQKPGKRNAWAPFTTSSLQQAASTRFGLPVGKTMQLAQRLYEAWHITYMRTDSTNLSKQALGMIEKEVKKRFTPKHHQVKIYASKSKGAQEAHEAIRPTKMSVDIAGADADQQKIYKLIRERTMASQMSAAQTLKTTADIAVSTRSELFRAKGEIVTFDGFLAVMEKRKDDTLLPDLSIWDALNYTQIVATQQFSKPPARFTEASLVKKLEELWIWRPSTYAPTIQTIQRRWYVQKWISEWVTTQHEVYTLDQQGVSSSTISKKLLSNKGKLVPTDVWLVVTDFLNEHFADIMDYQFTAQVEEQFDEIAEWKLVRHDMLNAFYTPFHDRVEVVVEYAERASGERELWTDPVSGKIVKVRVGRYGPLAQIGESDDDEVKFASLRWDLFLETITLEQALELFVLPRELWEREDKQIKASIGRFGPYVQRWSLFASLKEDDPYTIEFDRALELVKEKKKKDDEALLQNFEYKDVEWIVKMWRRWPFIKWKRNNIRLPKWIDGKEISQDEIIAYIEDAVASTKSKKKTTKKKATKKKTKKSVTKKEESGKK